MPVPGLRGRSLDFLPLTPKVGAASSESIHVCRRDEMRGGQGARRDEAAP